MSNRIMKIFMERDGMTKEEAIEEYNILSGEVWSALEDAEDLFEGSEEVEDILADYGLEPDYLDDLLF